jgi:hypothetical protein
VPPRGSRFSASVIAASLVSLGLGAGAGWLGAVPAASAAVETHNPAAVDSDFAQLVAGIASGPVKLLGGAARKELLFDQAVLAHRRIDAQPGDPCAILPTLARMRASLIAGTGRDGATVGTLVVSPIVAVQLESDILDIQGLLLSSGNAVACGGASAPSSPAAFPLTKVISSDNTEVTFHVSFPATRFS